MLNDMWYLAICFLLPLFVQMKHVIAATIALKGLGGLLFIFSSSFGAYLLVMFSCPIPTLYIFFLYDGCVSSPWVVAKLDLYGHMFSFKFQHLSIFESAVEDLGFRIFGLAREQEWTCGISWCLDCWWNTLFCYQVLYLAFISPIAYDFYNHDIEKPEFVNLFVKFTQVWSSLHTSACLI